jgi:cyclic 2,3-diphosphoglycerate synthetase
VLVDGEHYPPVIEDALETLSHRGHEIAAVVLAGGGEKVAGNIERLGAFHVLSGDPRKALGDALEDFHPDAVHDLSDEPVLDYRRRHEMAAIALIHHVAYEGADFRFEPPPRPRICSKPSIAVIGTGKRTGKTAVAAFAARILKDRGARPVIVAMGRGGPPQPEVLRGDEIDLSPAHLLALADSGKHAASDYIEDALLGRVPTVGCRRCGGGLAGAVEISNVDEGIRLANELPGDVVILEGSGSAIPPAHADVTLLVAPADLPEEYLAGYMGPYRLLLADALVVTMADSPLGSPSRISATASNVRNALRPGGRSERGGEIQVVNTVFRPTPTRPVEGADVFVATTAPERSAETIRRHLETEFGCRVVGMSHSLSDRRKLEEEIGAIGGEADILLCEVKAAAVDIATRRALDEGLQVVYMDNVPHAIDGNLHRLIEDMSELAARRFNG